MVDKEKIIDAALKTTECTKEFCECFGGVLCPISHSTACCLFCKDAPHLEASDEDKKTINEIGHCGNPRCNIAKAKIYFGFSI